MEEAERAVATLRLAIKDMFTRTGRVVEAWPDDDQDPVDPRKGGIAHGTVIRAGASRETGVRITYVMLGKEYETEIAPSDADYVSLMEDVLRRIIVPISAVRAYRANELIDKITVRMRGGW